MNNNYTDGYQEYAKFPMHYLRITQSYDEGNHIAHWKNADYQDFPVDLAGKDTNRDFLYAPVDMKIVKVQGIKNKNVSNKIFLESINEVYTPKHNKSKIFMTAVHFEDTDVEKYNLKEGRTVKQGEIICREGKETASANHLHITCGLSSANKSIKNNQGKWVTKGNCKKIEEIFYIDNNFTQIINDKNLKFISLPEKKLSIVGTPVKRNNNFNQIEILIENLHLRKEAGLNSEKIAYINKGIYNYHEKIVKDNYTWYKIDLGYVAYDSSWANIYLKVKKTNILKTIFSKLKELFKKILS